MPSITRIRLIEADPERVWAILKDPHHQPRWWPGVRRVEGVEGDRFTQVIHTRKDRPVRVDYRVAESEPPARRVWEQEIPGTPFERVLSESVIEFVLAPRGAGTQVTITQRQRLRGYSRTGGWMLRRATRRKLDQALEGLASVV